jgi:hypothetical protein
MHTARCNHATVYHSQYLCVLGGYDSDNCLEECESEESHWEVLPTLPIDCCGMTAVVLDNSLFYAFGGSDGLKNYSVQKLSLLCLTWELRQLKLPE